MEDIHISNLQKINISTILLDIVFPVTILLFSLFTYLTNYDDEIKHVQYIDLVPASTRLFSCHYDISFKVLNRQVTHVYAELR
jgi:hypothetical protein